MRAARVHAWGAPPSIDDVDEASARPDHTLVEVLGAAVGQVDVSIASGGFARHPELPYVPGVEGAGRVLASDRFAPGAAVWFRGGGLGTARDGTWVERLAVPDEVCSEVPPGVDPVLAACFFSPCTSAHVALHDLADLRPGERVAVTGAAGAVGSMTVQLALDAGADRVVGIVSGEGRRASVPAGAEVVIGRGAAAVDALAGETFDLLVDTVGGAGLADLLAVVAPGGRAVLLGYTAGNVVPLDLLAFMQRDVRLLPLNMIRREADARAAARRLLERLGAGDLHLAVHPMPLDQAAEALGRVGSGQADGRVVLVPGW